MDQARALLTTVLLLLSLPTFGSVRGEVADATLVERVQEGRVLVSGHPAKPAESFPVFDISLIKPVPPEDEVPRDANGIEDYRIANYACFTPGARELQAYHRLNGGLNRISVGVLLKVLTKDANRRGLTIPRNPLDLVNHYPSLRIDEINRVSEHLIRMRGDQVLNAAAYMHLTGEGVDPRQALTEWIHPLDDYAGHNLTWQTGAMYVPEEQRIPGNPIRDYIDNAVADEETAAVLHFFFATPLIGHQSLKALTFLIGLKNAGKSLILNTVGAMYGSYVMTVPPVDMLPFAEQRLVKELFANLGKRVLRIDELNGESYFNEPLVKRVTGRDGLANAFVTHPIREFHPQVKIFCDSNAPLKPQIGTESAISDRLYYVPFGKVIPKDQRDPYLESILTKDENLDAYFSWLVDTHLINVVRGRV